MNEPSKWAVEAGWNAAIRVACVYGRTVPTEFANQSPQEVICCIEETQNAINQACAEKDKEIERLKAQAALYERASKVVTSDRMEKAVPTSFDFDGSALRPDYVVKCSYGNDSIALIQWLHEYDQQFPLGKVVTLFNDTGWATEWWPERVKKGEALACRYGFIPARTESIGMLRLLANHNCWPRRGMQFCTEELKIIPTLEWLKRHDPEGIAEMVCGVRRAESKERALWPEYLETSDKNEGRAEWSPMVFLSEAERNTLILRAGWQVLPHRSRECRCINAGSQDILKFSEQDIEDINAAELGMKCWGDNRFMFSPRKKAGRPEGIRAVVEWAKQVKPREAKLESNAGCDSGYCTS